MNCVISVIYSEMFWGRRIHTLNSRRWHHGWRQVEKVSKFVPPDTLMHFLVLSVLRFLRQILFKLLKLSLEKIILCGRFLKNSYIQIKNLHGYKLVGAEKWSKYAASSADGITQSSINFFRKRKSEYSPDLLSSCMNENTFADSLFFHFDLFFSLIFSPIRIFEFESFQNN